MRQDELRELADEMLADMYEDADPPLDFYDVVENPEEYPDDWYQQHTLSNERIREIFDKHTEDVSLTSAEHAELSLTVLTSLAPATPE